MILRVIIDNHEGEITAESDGEGLGSQFSIKLPAAYPGKS